MNELRNRIREVLEDDWTGTVLECCGYDLDTDELVNDFDEDGLKGFLITREDFIRDDEYTHLEFIEAMNKEIEIARQYYMTERM